MDQTIPVVVAPGGAATTSSSVIQVFMPNMVTGAQIAVPPVETYQMKRGVNSSGHSCAGHCYANAIYCPKS
jgi:hypothetical protein